MSEILTDERLAFLYGAIRSAGISPVELDRDHEALRARCEQAEATIRGLRYELQIILDDASNAERVARLAQNALDTSEDNREGSVQ